MKQAKDRKMQNQFTREAVEFFEAALADFHQKSCTAADSAAKPEGTVTEQAMRTAIVETCRTLASRYSEPPTTIEGKRVA
jgi:hypothetical protein